MRPVHRAVVQQLRGHEEAVSSLCAFGDDYAPVEVGIGRYECGIRV